MKKQPQHAKLSASASERWMTCPASIKAIDALPESEKNKRSNYADEGSFAHHLAEKCLREYKTAFEFIGKSSNELGFKDAHFVVDNEFASFVQLYIDYIDDLVPQLSKHTFLVEQRVDFSKYVPDGFGTADCVIYDHEKDTLHVVDLKFGRGVEVNAENNSQLMLYALGAFTSTPNVCEYMDRKTTVCLHIVQPRIYNYSIHTISADELISFSHEVAVRATIALGDEAYFQPSEKGCQFCPVKPTCKALAEHSFNAITADFDDIESVEALTPVENLTPLQISQILLKLPTVEAWIKSIKEYAFNLANNDQLPDHKLVAGRSSRKWRNEQDAVAALSSMGIEPFKTELLSVAQAEKLLTKEQKQELKELYTSTSGVASVVHISDKRPALKNTLDFFECG